MQRQALDGVPLIRDSQLQRGTKPGLIGCAPFAVAPPAAGTAARAEYVPWAAFCRGVQAMMSLAFMSAPISTSFSTVS